MIYLTIINALPVKQRMKNAFLENHIFTEYNLDILVSSLYSDSLGSRRRHIQCHDCTVLHSLLWPPVKMFPRFAPQATDLHAKTGGRDTTSSGVAGQGKNLQAEAVQN